MVWRKLYLDLTLVPLALLSSLLYHCWLSYTVSTQPNRTYSAINTLGQRAWFAAMLKDNDKKNVLAVQTIRNNIMGSTLMATTSILICCGLLTFASKAYSNNDNSAFALGGNDELNVDSKCAALLFGFLSVFLCQSLSVVFLTQVNILINTLAIASTPIRKDHVLKMLEKGLFLSTIGNRLFFTTLPLMLWIFGPVFVLASTVGMIAVMYNVDIVSCGDEKGTAAVEDGRMSDGEFVEP